MTNDKLLMALIDALGFEVEETIVSNSPCRESNYGLIDDQGELDSTNLKVVDLTPEVDYKLTKREGAIAEMVQCGKHKVSVRQLIDNINELSELDQEYRFIKYNKEAILAIISSGAFNGKVYPITNGYLINSVKVTFDG